MTRYNIGMGAPDHLAAGRTRGTMYAVVALVAVLAMVIFYPPARVFLAISIPIGVVCAVILYFVNRRPVKLPDEENKRPLGL